MKLQHLVIFSAPLWTSWNHYTWLGRLGPRLTSVSTISPSLTGSPQAAGRSDASVAHVFPRGRHRLPLYSKEEAKDKLLHKRSSIWLWVGGFESCGHWRGRQIESHVHYTRVPQNMKGSGTTTPLCFSIQGMICLTGVASKFQLEAFWRGLLPANEGRKIVANTLLIIAGSCTRAES